MLRVCDEERCRQRRELAARTGDAAHLRAAVADAPAALAVAHEVDRAGHGDDAAGLSGERLDQRHAVVEVCLRHGIDRIGVHALGRAAAGAEGLDLGDVAAHGVKAHLAHEPVGRVGAQAARACAHGVEQDDVPEGVCLPAGEEHGGDGVFVERADVDVQAAADARDVLDIVGIVGHDRRAAGRQQDVCDVVDGDVVCDVVHERRFRAHVFQHGLEHLLHRNDSFLLRKCLHEKTAAPVKSAAVAVRQYESLRWHCPNQVCGSKRMLTLSRAAPRVCSLHDRTKPPACQGRNVKSSPLCGTGTLHGRGFRLYTRCVK